MPKRSLLFEESIRKSWWVILLLLICLFAYDRAVTQKQLEEEHFRKKLEEIHLATKQALETQEELCQQIESQNDPAWIELTLMKRLGLVPEGKTKILFVHPQPPTPSS